MVYELVDQGIGVVWSTAYLDEAERCARVLLLNEGKVLDDGPPGELTARVAGRSFLVQGAGEARRKVLTAALKRPRSHRRRDPGQRASGWSIRQGSMPPDPAMLGRRRARDQAGRTAVRGRIRRPARRRPEGRIAARRRPVALPRWRRTVVEAQRADQAVRRLHRRRPDHASGSAGARSSACSAPTAPASRPRSR